MPSVEAIEWVPVRIAADLLSVGTPTVRRLIKQGKLRAIRPGERALKVALEDVEARLQPIDAA